MKKILYVSPNGYLGGAERFVLTAVKGHALGRNIDASILFFSEGEACEEARAAGLKIYVLKQSFRFRHPWNLFRALVEIRSIVKSIQPNVLHLTMAYSHIVMSLATLGLKFKKVWFQHGPVGGYLDQIANLFSVDMLLYNSKNLQRKHKETWPPTRVKIQEEIIKLGVSCSIKPHQLFQNSIISLGAGGRITSGKGYHNLLIALGELKQKVSLRPFKLQIAGSAKKINDQNYKNKLLDIIKDYNLINEVTFLEHINKMEEFYKELDIFIHSAVIEEGFGLVVAEAMLAGCLVISSDSGGVADLIKNNETGINFPAGSNKAVSELKKTLNVFLNAEENFSKEKYQSMATKGKEYIQKNYSVEQMMNQLEDLYLVL